MKKHIINVKKKKKEWRDGPGGWHCYTMLPHRQKTWGWRVKRQGVDGVDGLPACPPGKAPGPVSDSVRPTASEEDIWCWPQRNEVGWGSWVPLKYNLKILARGSIGLSSLGAVQDRSGALAYHAGDPRSDVRHHTHTHTKHTCTCAHGSFIAVLP